MGFSLAQGQLFRCLLILGAGTCVFSGCHAPLDKCISIPILITLKPNESQKQQQQKDKVI